MRVVPIPLSNGWCVDVLIKELLSSGSRTSTLESDRSSTRRRLVRRFATIDSAARFLQRLGIDTFQVDMADAISFVTAGAGVPSVEEGDEVPEPGTPRT